MVAMPCKGHLPPIGTDQKNKPKNGHGFLLLRPLYGGRGDPMRWRIILPKRLRSHGFTQPESDVCMFTKYECRGSLSAYLVCHVGDILLTGTDIEVDNVENDLRTFR